MAEPQTTQTTQTTVQRRRSGGMLATVRGDLSNPLFRNAYALMVNGGLTGILGLGYWLVAARFYTPADVGRNCAEIQAIMFVGGLTALNYMLIRFIPQAGRRTTALVLWTYLAGAVAAGVIGVGFLLTVGWWGPSFARLSSLGPALLFLAAVLAWNIFTQQDGVFTGLRRSGWVPIENTLFGIAKIVLLVALAAVIPHDGMVLATAVPVFIAIIPINWLILRRLVPAHVTETAGRRRPPTLGQIGRFIGGDYVGGLFSHAAINLIPVVVAAHLTAGAYAHFNMAWVLGAMLDLLALTMAMSLTAEGAFAADRLAGTCRAALRRTLTLLVPAAAMLALAAPWGLRVFGPGYEQGAVLLQLLAATALPKAIIEIYIGVLRVQSRTRPIAILQAVRFLGVLAVILTVTGGQYLTTTGLAVLAVHITVAVAVYPKLRRIMRADRPALMDPSATSPMRVSC